MTEKKPFDTKALREKYGIRGYSIIQIVGTIFVIAITITIIHHFW